MAHALGIDVNDRLELGEGVFDVQDFIDLFLVLGDHDPGFRVLQHIFDLAIDGILIQRHGNAPQGFRSQQHPVQGRPVIADDRQLLPPLHL